VPRWDDQRESSCNFIDIGPIISVPGGSNLIASVIAAALACPDLLDRCVAGDRGAWRELHALYRPQALAFLRRLGVGEREAEDACQDIFLQVFRYLPNFERRAEFRTWLYKLCIGQAARARRRALLAAPLSWLRRQLAEPVTLPELSAARALELVDGALTTLNARQREVFVLFELEELPTAEIARLLDAPPATVRRQLQEARHKFECFVREQPLGKKP
jgi:RNA polymerase sigma-70 factor (ECF subfamily)